MSCNKGRLAAKFFPVHPRCVGAEVKHAVGGGSKYRRNPKLEIEVL